MYWAIFIIVTTEQTNKQPSDLNASLLLTGDKGRHQFKKKMFSFRHCPNYLNPPPWPQFGQLGPLFSDVKIQDLKVNLKQPKTTLNNLKQPKKTIKSAIHWHFWRNRLFLLTKNALLERGPKNSGMGRPPPSFGQCPKENVFFLLMSSLTPTLAMLFCSTKNQSVTGGEQDICTTQITAAHKNSFTSLCLDFIFWVTLFLIKIFF